MNINQGILGRWTLLSRSAVDKSDDGGPDHSSSSRTATPLLWPQRFPPLDWWGRFFTGIPPLGPSVAFFSQLEREQASRTQQVMVCWTSNQDRIIALKLGECLQTLGWKTPFFIPPDQLLAVIGGPSFVTYVQQDLAYLLDEFSRQFGRQMESDYLRSVIDWSDSSVCFGDLVGRIQTALEGKGGRVSDPEMNRPNN